MKIYTKDDFNWIDEIGIIPSYPPYIGYQLAKQQDEHFWNQFKGYTLNQNSNSIGALWTYIPFCKVKCSFCPFPVSVSRSESFRHEYMNLLKDDLIRRSTYPSIQKLKIKTLAIQGGTPTLLPTKELTDYIELCYKQLQFDFGSDFLGSIEISPDTICDDQDKIRALKDLNIRYFRIGVQSFQTELNQNMIRSHTAEEAKKAVRVAKQEDINVSVDLMFGLPGQSIALIEKDLKDIEDLQPDEITLFNFGIQRPSISWRKQVNKGKVIQFPNMHDKLNMAQHWAKRLAELGYVRKNLVNWVRLKSLKVKKIQLLYDIPLRHTSHDWDVIGVGPYSISKTNGIFGHGHFDLHEYMQDAKTMEIPIFIARKDEPGDRMIRYILMSSFQTNGLNKGVFKKRFGEEFSELFPEQLSKLKQLNLLEENDEWIRPTDLGLLYIAGIGQEFYSETVKKDIKIKKTADGNEKGIEILHSFK